MLHAALSHTSVPLAAAFVAAVVVIWFMVGYQLVLTVAGYLLYVRAEGEKQAADRIARGEADSPSCGTGILPVKRSGTGFQPVSETPNWPTVSILIPAHNEEKLIERTVRAMLRLDYPADRVEILVIDDGATDRTAEILDRLAAEDPRVRPYHVQPGQGGKGKSRALNLGRRVATGEIFASTFAASV